MGCKKNEITTFPKLNHEEWKIVRNADSTNTFWGLSFSDQLNGWAVGDSGIILHTSDGGNTWIIQDSGTKITFWCVRFINSQKGIIGGTNNTIGITTNGGITWIWQHPTGEPNRTFRSISFINENQGWIVDNYGGILHTEDGGINWVPQISGTTYCITAVQFLDTHEGWATATNRITLHTTDGGSNWVSKILDTLNYGGWVIYTDIFFYNHTKGWIATNATVNSGIPPLMASVVCSSDSGRNWGCNLSGADMITSLQFVNENSGWAAARRGILHTTDGGLTWGYQLQIPSGPFNKLCFVDQSHGWAITYSGNIYRYEIN